MGWIKDQKFTDTDLFDMAYTLQLGRGAMEERLAVIVTSIKELEEKLKGFLKEQDSIENFYKGQVKSNEDTLSVFKADKDMAKTIDAWIKKRKYAKLITLWVKGLIVDWNKLYDQIKPRRISLPTYPFARERYWMPEEGRQWIDDRRQGTEDSVQEAFEMMTFEEVWQEKSLPDTSPVKIKTLVCFLSHPGNQQVMVEAKQSFDEQTEIIFILQNETYKRQSPRMYDIVRADKNT